jgi:hypothetical protein
MACTTTTRPIVIFTRNDYERIKKEGFSYTLPDETLKTIKTISANVGAPEYIKTPHFDKRQQIHKQYSNNHGHNNNHNHNIQHRIPPREISDTEWDALRSFKATTFEKKKGVELSIDKIRKHLNKLTDKTYEKITVQIIAEIESILAVKNEIANAQALADAQAQDVVSAATKEMLLELNRIGDALFEIASGNSFYSKMYATLYNELMTKYDFMQNILSTKLATDISILSDFAYCDPNKDYDQFCRNNKSNEKRRALSLFYVNLMLLKIIPAEKIVEMISGLQTDMLAYIKKENSVNIVEEISELLFILTTNSSARLKLMKPEWEQIVENISLVSAMKAKSEPSISNKTIFKHMDIKTAISK